MTQPSGMRIGLVTTFSSVSLAWLVSCSGQVSQPDVLLGSGGSSTSASGGASSSGGSGTGGSIAIVPTPEPNPTDDCVLAAGTTEYTRSQAEWVCYSLDSFSETDASQSFPTFAVGGMGGLGGSAGSACPSAAELDWSCRGGEGRCCPSPQCEAPEAATAIDGQCCYVVRLGCGV